MATNSYTKLHRAVRTGQLYEAHEVFKNIMQQKVATRLSEERKGLMECDEKVDEDFGVQKACPKCKHSLKEHDADDGCSHSGCKCMESGE